MRSSVIAAGLAALAVAASAQAATYRLGGIEVAQPWSRPAPAGTNGAGFMTLANKGKTAQVLTAVETPAAARVEMHKTSMAGGIMSMKKLETGLALAPGESATFAPGGYHLMLIGLTKALKAGDKVPATLVFASGARIKVEFAVGSGPGAAEAPMAMDHMEHMNH